MITKEMQQSMTARLNRVEGQLRGIRRMVDEQAIYSTSGKRIACQVDSICVHGDGPTAVTVSKAVRDGLEAAGIRIVPLTEMPNLKH